MRVVLALTVSPFSVFFHALALFVAHLTHTHRYTRGVMHVCVRTLLRFAILLTAAVRAFRKLHLHSAPSPDSPLISFDEPTGACCCLRDDLAPYRAQPCWAPSSPAPPHTHLLTYGSMPVPMCTWSERDPCVSASTFASILLPLTHATPINRQPQPFPFPPPRRTPNSATEQHTANGIVWLVICRRICRLHPWAGTRHHHSKEANP
jgi:hypothetical protein